MRLPLAAALFATCVTSATVATNAGADDGAKAKAGATAKPYCAPEVSELSHHVCYFDGGTPADGRKTLVIYLHGALAMNNGFFYLQQRGMALHAKKHGFTVLMPTSPSDGGGYVWPTSQTAQKEQEAGIIAGIQQGRAELEKRLGRRFDETFVVGFSSGAYYGSSLAVRGVLDVDGYIVLAGGSSWVKSDEAARKRAPIFVGVSAADRQTAAHSRALAGSLAAMGWPFKVEERDAGHMVDWTFMAHGMAWLRSRKQLGTAAALSNVSAAAQ
jgi:predicted esterase